MNDEKLLAIGRALVEIIEKIKSGDVKNTSLESQVAFFQLENQVYRIHISNLEDPVYYGRAQSADEPDDEEDDEELIDV